MEPLDSGDPEELGPYRLLARLGAGGMGRVYLATPLQGRTVAVKAIRPEMLGDRGFRIRFRREVAAATAVGGRYTAPVVNADPDATTPWLATEYIPGPTLAEAVAEHGPLPVESVLALGAGIAEALIAVQAAGLVHRDLKPSNVLLAADGPRVIDFGIVRASDGYDLTRSGALFGSFEYMCPEQATGDPMGTEGDIFSLGSVLAFAASGHAPFSGSAAATILYNVVHGAPDLTNVPEPLDKIISLCLSRDPRLRITPDRLSAACAPNGVEQVTGDGWLPAPVVSSIALRTAAVTALTAPLRDPFTPPAGTDGSAPAGSVPPGSVPPGSVPPGSVPPGSVPPGSVPPGSVPHGSTPPVYGQGWETPAAAPRPTYGSGAVGHTGEVQAVTGPPGPGPSPYYPPPEEPGPYNSTSPGHRLVLPRRGLSRRSVLTLSAATTAAVAAGTAMLITHGKKADRQSAEPLGPAPKPLWTNRSGPLLQAPAVFNQGTALLKARPGDLLCLDLKDGTKPKWVYKGISQSPTPALLVSGAAVALGEGSTVIGVDPASGTERFTLDFGADYRFDTLLGSYGEDLLSIVGLRLERRSEEEGVATSTNTVFRVDLEARRANVIPISPEDVGIKLKPVIVPGSFVYADGLRNVTARDTNDEGKLRWKHAVGYDLLPGLAVLDSTVFAVGRELMALSLSTGRTRWRVRADRGQFASLGVSGSTVYVTGTDPSGLYAFNAANGSRRWFCPTPNLHVEAPVTVGPDAVYLHAFKTKDGFYAIGTARGELLWNFTDGRETGVNDWQLACAPSGHLVAQHYDRIYGFPAS